MPTNMQVLDRFKSLFHSFKSRMSRIEKLTSELIQLFKKNSFQTQHKNTVRDKIKKLLLVDENKRKNKKIKNELMENIFDIVNKNGLWLTSDDTNSMKFKLSLKGKLVIVKINQKTI